MKGKILQKFIAVILVFCLTSVNFILVGTNAVVALSTGAITIKNSNIVFDAYFKDGENKVYSKTGTIASGEKLYLNLEAKSGVLENAKVKIDNANFVIVKDEVKNQYVSFVNEDTNEIELKNITYGKQIEIELPIRFEKSDYISTDYFSMENSITLSGKYKDASEQDVSGTINTSLAWTNEVKTNYETNIEKIIKKEDKILIQQKIISTVEGNVLPKTKETVKITVPKIDEKLPSKINVLVNGNKISDETITNNYNTTEGTLEFSKEFINDNKISWGTGTEQYAIVYIYDQEITNTQKEVTAFADVQTQIYGYDEALKGSTQASFTSGSENIGATVSISAEADTNDIYKGYMYSNSEETKYGENYKVEISDKTDINNVNVEFVEDNFKTQEGTLSTNGMTAYKEIKINKENMQNILGQEGTITIEDSEGNAQVIDNNSEVNEQGYIVKTLDTNKIKISTSKPQQEGVLNIYSLKAIKGNAGYNREQLKTINSIETKMKVLTDKNDEVSEVLVEKELKETTTEATLEMNNENRGNILSAIDENNVEFIATLKTGTIDADLYKEPTIKIILPKEVNSISGLNVSALYAGNELEIERYNEGDNGDGRKTIEIKLKGEQIKYDNKLSDGIKVTVNAAISLEELSPSTNSKIEMKYTNENGSEKEYSTEIDVNIESRDGVILRNILEIEGIDTKKTFNEEVLSQLLEVDNKQKIAKVDVAIVNNYDKAIEDVSVVGKLPVEGIEENLFETALKNTFSANIINGINVDGNVVEILYSEDENAKADSDSWKQDSENAKSYKIVIKDNKLDVGEKLELNYDIVIPKDILFNESVYQKVELSYTYQGQVLTKAAASSLYTQIKSSDKVEEEAKGISENIDGLGVKVVAISGGKELNNGDEVYEGQTIKYVLTFTNNTNKDITGLKVEANHENANVFGEVTNKEADSWNTSEMKDFTTIVEKEGVSNLSIDLDTIKAGETKTTYYQIRAKEDVNELNGNIKISANDIEEKTIQTNNLVKEGILKLTSTTNAIRENPLSQKDSFTNRLTIKNMSNEKLENLNIEFSIPQELKLNTIDYSSEYTILEQNDNYFKVELKELESNQEKDIVVLLNVNDNIEKEAVNIQFYVQKDNNTYLSNELEILLNPITYGNIESLQTGSVEKDTVQTGDKVIFKTTIKNIGEGDINYLRIIDIVPDVAVITNAYIERNGSNEQVENTENNIIVKTIQEVKPEEELKLVVETQIDESKENTPSITNIVKLQSENESVESNGVTYKLKNYVDDSSDDNNPGDNDDPSVTTAYSISGIAWVDENKNGIRDTSEKTLEGIEVSLANTETGKYVLDADGNKLIVTTDQSGRYVFEDIEKGKYMVVFKYDNVTYRNTEYRASGATESTNSDVITSKVGTDDSTRYAVTDTLELSEESLYNIDAGFIENEIFDLSLNKYINKITIQNNAGTVVKQYDKEQLAKIEIDAKQITGSTVLMEFEIQVTNEGELPGYANEIVDYIPTDLSFSSEINKDWYTTTDGNLHTTALSKELINPGETKTITLILVKTMTENNVGRTSNTAEIAKSSNDLLIPDKDSTSGNNVQGEDDISTAEVIISIRTGLVVTIGIITVIIVLAVGGIAIYTMKRKEERHE